MKVSIVKNLSHVVKDMEIADVLEKIRSDAFKEMIEYLRKMKNVVGAPYVEQDYRKAKEKLPAFTPSGTFEKGTKAECFRTYSGIIVLDIDHLKAEDVPNFKFQISNFRYTYACFVSPSGLGLKVLVRVDNDEKHHREAFNKVKEYYEKQLGVSIDKSGVNINRLCFFSWDRELYFNPDSEIFKTNINMGQTDIENIISQIEAKQVDITADYNDWVKICFALISEFGESARDYFHRISRFHAGYEHKTCDLLFTNCLKTGSKTISIKTFFFLAKQADIDIRSVRSYNINEMEELSKHNENKPSEKKRKKLTQIEDYLKNKYEFRKNTVTGRIEYRLKFICRDFVQMDDYTENSFIRELQTKDMRCSVQNLRIILDSDFTEKFDPFLDYFYSLEKWDGATDHIAAFAKAVPTDNDALFTKFFRKWLVGVVACAIDDNKINHEVLILTSIKQGIGKSTFCDSLCPPALSKYYYSGLINPEDKDTLISLGECMLINLEELQTMRKHENEALKDIITKKAIRIRRPYARNNETMVRRASFMGTGNASQFLTDPSGSRRYLSFTVIDNINNEHTVDINNVYSQAYALYKQNYKYWFDREEIDEIEVQNEQFQIKSIEEELLLKFFEPVPKADAYNFMSTTEILTKMHIQTSFNFNEGSLIRLGKALKKHGFERTKKKGLYVWTVKELSTLN